MHYSLIRVGWFCCFLEFIWACAWFGIEIWFNLEPQARIYEQALFDGIIRIVGLLTIVRVIDLLHDKKPISWFYKFVIWGVGFIMSRQVLLLYRGGVLYGGTYYDTLTGMFWAGMGITVLELLWMGMAVMYTNFPIWTGGFGLYVTFNKPKKYEEASSELKTPVGHFLKK